MKYDELSELIDALVTRQLDEMGVDSMRLSYRNAARSGLLNSILIGMTDEERETIAKRHGLKKKAPIINDNGEDSI